MKRIIILFFFFGIHCALISQSKPEVKIGFLLDYYTQESEPYLIKLKNEITAVVGEDATVLFSALHQESNNLDVNKLRANYNELINGDSDIIIAFGTLSNLIVGQQVTHKKPTILFGAINSDIVKLDYNKTESGIENFNFIITSQSYKEDLNLFKSLYNYKNIAILVEDFLPELNIIKQTIANEVSALDSNHKFIAYHNLQDILINLKDVDAVYLAGGFHLKDNDIKELANYCILNNLPSFTSSYVEDVELGIMATNKAKENLERFFRRIALNIESIINGKNASELPVYLDYNSQLTVNYNTADQIGIPIKYSLIANTNFVGNVEKIESENTYSLLDVFNQTIKNNLSLLSQKKNVELKTQDVKTAKSNYYPEVTASATGSYLDPKIAEISGGVNPEYQTSGNVTLTQTLYSEAVNANITIQENLENAEKQNYNAAVLDAILNASTAYFNSLILKANTKIQSQNLEVTKRNLEIAKQNYEAGQTGKMDVLRLKSEEAQNRQTFVEAINQLNQSFLNLNVVLNNPIDFKIDIKDTELSKGIFEKYNYKQLGKFIDDPGMREAFIEFLIEEAKTNAPELAGLDYNLKATQRTLKLNSSGRFVPTLALQGQYNKDFNQWGKGSTPTPIYDNNYNVGLNLSIPIFQQNKKNINKQIAIIQQEQLNLNKENLELSIEQGVNEAILEIINEITNIELSRISEETAKESLDLVQTSYSNGAVNITQLLDAQRNYLQAQLSKANATYNYLLGSMRLERNIGKYFLLSTDAENEDFIQRFNTFLLNKN